MGSALGETEVTIGDEKTDNPNLPPEERAKAAVELAKKYNLYPIDPPPSNEVGAAPDLTSEKLEKARQDARLRSRTGMGRMSTFLTRPAPTLLGMP